MPTVDVRGAGFHYEERGSGRPVLFIHGSGTYSALWEWTLECFPAGMRLVTYDRRGFAATPGRARGIGEHVEDAAALLERLDLAPAAVVAPSGAGPIALRLAVEHPSLVDALVLAEPVYQAALVRPSAAALRTLPLTIYRWRIRRDARAAALGYYRWASRYETGGNAYDGYPELWRRTALGHAESALRELLQLAAPLPSARQVRAIACPVTLVFADNGEPLCRRTTRRVQRLLPESRAVTIPGDGHLMFTDQPRAFAAAVAGRLPRAS